MYDATELPLMERGYDDSHRQSGNAEGGCRCKRFPIQAPRFVTDRNAEAKEAKGFMGLRFIAGISPINHVEIWI